MKASLMAAVWAPLAFSACAPADHMLFHDAFALAHGRAVNARQYKADVKRCGGPGPGAEWCRVAADDGYLDRLFPLELKPQPKGVSYAYEASQCAGTFEHGLCRGVSQPQVRPPATCHGEIIDGVCSGPVF
jgi:hypothetical protein